MMQADYLGQHFEVRNMGEGWQAWITDGEIPISEVLPTEQQAFKAAIASCDLADQEDPQFRYGGKWGERTGREEELAAIGKRLNYLLSFYQPGRAWVPLSEIMSLVKQTTEDEQLLSYIRRRIHRMLGKDDAIRRNNGGVEILSAQVTRVLASATH